MKTKWLGLVLVGFAVLFGLVVGNNQGVLQSDEDCAFFCAMSLHEVMQDPQIDLSSGIQKLHNKHFRVCGREMSVKIHTVGDIGWPTVVDFVTVQFYDDAGFLRNSFHFGMLN